MKMEVTFIMIPDRTNKCKAYCSITRLANLPREFCSFISSRLALVRRQLGSLPHPGSISVPEPRKMMLLRRDTHL